MKKKYALYCERAEPMAIGLSVRQVKLLSQYFDGALPFMRHFKRTAKSYAADRKNLTKLNRGIAQLKRIVQRAASGQGLEGTKISNA